jgi:cysteine desulfurase
MRTADGAVYLDANATLPMCREATEAFLEAERTAFANPSSPYPAGRKARETLERARSEILGLLKLEGELVFTGSGTEANHLAVFSAAAARSEKRVLISSIEHPSCYELRKPLAAMGITVEEFGAGGSGVVDLDRLGELLRSPASLVVILAAHNESGVIQPIEEAIKMCRENGTLFHTDAVQAFGKIETPSMNACPDTMTLAAHKIGGPKGMGALFFKKGTEIVPMLRGGGQEKGLRASTEAVSLASAFAAAAGTIDLETYSRLGGLRDGLEENISRFADAEFFGKGVPRLPNTSFFSIKGKDGRKLQARLASEGFYAGTGSACHGGGGELPKVLREMGKDISDYPLRISLSKYSTAEELDLFAGVLEKVVKMV